MSIDIVPTVIYSSMMGMTIFALVDVASRDKHKQSLYLIGLLALLLVHIIGELFIYSGAYQYAPALAGLQFPIRMLLGPALYFYAFATMSPEKALPKKAHILALLGPVIVIIGMLPFIFGITSDEKLAMANPATRDPELFKIAVFTCVFSMCTFIVFTGLYLAATFKLQNQHCLQLMERFSDIEKRSMNWFKTVLVLWGFVWLFFSLDYGISFIGWTWFGSGAILHLFEALVLVIFCHFALKQPLLSDSDKGQPQSKQPRTATLDEATMALIASKLKNAMSEEALFLEEELSLKRLSDVISVSENHISETFSQCLHTNFFQFVNSYRIKQAMSLLTSTNKTVSVIAYDVGFNSKSTFNTAFKKIAGATPTAYRSQANSLSNEQTIG
ncbi:HTH-type transcriptional activator RhaR [Pseudoalteromonas holothuriae]|uniref:HTH-type transcriptional activator RhaR n=1 Tax=Pseudoalteromonas holothuriae TaxID=2963714 RepID=A0A9W4QRQ2_9GAMM|nr:MULTISPECIES: helix-turn-helix transcriptional regulator [unclassified Pseudoalteromonas]CAH9050260.1 HTH-type transcriptional activator RhaR [Pseudoalteromonas sp. CIP111854]CAH9067946.1 HTH-type transcriptional activator RhaR [Pseudoalteromonas sp. CIP111951]